MNHPIQMQVADSLHHLANIVGCLLFAKVPCLLYLSIQVVRACLHDEIDFTPAKEKTIGRQNIRMLAEQLNFELVNHEVQCDFLLIKGLEDSQEMGLLLQGQI